MDNRKGLPSGTALHFPGMVCVVETEIGRGSNAIVYNGWYQDALNPGQKHHVLIKELFPYHPFGAITRDEKSLHICCREDGQDVMQIHRQSFIWGNEAHLRLREKAPASVGGNINTFAYHDTYYTLLDFSGGRTLYHEMQSGSSPSLRSVVCRMMDLLESLHIFHDMDFLHLDISPDNVLLIRPNKREYVELIDYNSVVPLSSLQAGRQLQLSVKQGYAAPEVRSQTLSAIGKWTDLYSVTAVFFYCLMGRPLSSMEYSGVLQVNVSRCPLLTDAPETVKSLVARIVTRGLAPVAKRRYQTVDEMRMDMQELLDRIDGVGVTHWSLWETSRQSIQRETRINPALAHLLHEEELYPLEMDAPPDSGMDAFLQGQCNAVLTGGGGVGKTTLLMRTALQQSRSYRRSQPAVAYVSLYGYQPGEASFIHNHLLRRMRFKPETDGYVGARHTLDLLLQEPLTTRNGARPVLCLLLDGYNEVEGDTQALKQEIQQLAQMDGVAVILSSRTELPEFGFTSWTLRPLSMDSVCDVLKRKGLLLPEDETMRELLRNALMLNLYLRACQDGQEQFVIRTKEELIQAYLNALLRKELLSLPDGSPQKWQIEAALRCVYPLIAGMEARKKRSISSTELLAMVHTLYSSLGKRTLLKRFPTWAGHASDIRGEAQDSEAWYGLMVHDLLWRKLGLLYQNADGAYRTVHQEIRDTLAPYGQRLSGTFTRQRYGKAAMIGTLCLIAALGGWAAWPKTAPQLPAYDAQESISALDDVQLMYLGLNKQFTTMTTLLQGGDDGGMLTLLAGSNPFDQARKSLTGNSVLIAEDLNHDGAINDEMTSKADTRCQTGARFPWNNQTFDRSSFLEMAALFDQRQETYGAYIDILEKIQQEESAEDYQGVVQDIQAVLEADARIAAAYYQMLYVTPTSGMVAWENSADGQAYKGTYERMEDGNRLCEETASYALSQWKELSPEEMITALSAAEDAQFAARKALTSNAIYVIYEEKRKVDTL